MNNEHFWSQMESSWESIKPLIVSAINRATIQEIVAFELVSLITLGLFYFFVIRRFRKRKSEALQLMETVIDNQDKYLDFARKDRDTLLKMHYECMQSMESTIETLSNALSNNYESKKGKS